MKLKSADDKRRSSKKFRDLGGAQVSRQIRKGLKRREIFGKYTAQNSGRTPLKTAVNLPFGSSKQ